MANIKVNIEPPAEVPYLWICPYLSFYLVISNHRIKEETYVSHLFLNKKGRILLLFNNDDDASSLIPFEDVMAVFKGIDEAMSYINKGRPFIDREKPKLLPYVLGLDLGRLRQYQIAKVELEIAKANLEKAQKDLGLICL